MMRKPGPLGELGKADFFMMRKPGPFGELGKADFFMMRKSGPTLGRKLIDDLFIGEPGSMIWGAISYLTFS